MKLIALIGKKGAGKFAQVDDEDFNRLNKHRWHLTPYGYAATRKRIKYGVHRTVQMHRMIMQTPRHLDTDHRDGIELNNQKYNLRVCTRKQNIQNQTIHKNNTSGYKGVCWNKSIKKWIAGISPNRKTIHLGCFLDKNEAAFAYNRAAKKYFGEFAHLNIIKE
jgi:hypothetical protein